MTGLIRKTFSMQGSMLGLAVALALAAAPLCAARASECKVALESAQEHVKQLAQLQVKIAQSKDQDKPIQLAELKERVAIAVERFGDSFKALLKAEAAKISRTATQPKKENEARGSERKELVVPHQVVEQFTIPLDDLKVWYLGGSDVIFKRTFAEEPAGVMSLRTGSRTAPFSTAYKNAFPLVTRLVNGRLLISSGQEIEVINSSGGVFARQGALQISSAEMPQEKVRTAGFSPDGHYLVRAHGANELRLYDMTSADPQTAVKSAVLDLPPSSDSRSSPVILAPAFSTTSTEVVVSVNVWQDNDFVNQTFLLPLSTFKPKLVLDLKNEVKNVMSLSDQSIVALGEDQAWIVNANGSKSEIPVTSSHGIGAEYNKQLLVWSQLGFVLVDPLTGRRTRLVDDPDDDFRAREEFARLRDFAISRDGERAILYSSSPIERMRPTQVYSLDRGHLTDLSAKVNFSIESAQFSPDGKSALLFSRTRQAVVRFE